MATVNEKMTAIADAIRDKTGRTEALTLDGMAESVSEVYDAGKKSQYDEFWDTFQFNGQRRDYYRAFFNYTLSSPGSSWNEVTFRPKYDLKPTRIQQGFTALKVGDLEAHLKECGIVLDLSECTGLQNGFQSSSMTVFPTLHLKNASDITSMFNMCRQLHTIRKIIFESGTRASFTSMFSNCTALANIDEVEGSIECSITLASSPLTVSTMKKIISHLKDYTGVTDDEGTSLEFAYKVSFSSKCITALEAEGATAEYNGTACTWLELIHYKKWDS